MNLSRINTKEIRKFGIILSTILIILGSIHLWKNNTKIFPWFYSVAFVCLLASVFFTKLILPVYTTFNKISHVLGWLNTRLLLIIIFYLIFTPIGLIMKLFKENPLNRKIEKEKSSYWLDKKFSDTPDYYENQF